MIKMYRYSILCYIMFPDKDMDSEQQAVISKIITLYNANMRLNKIAQNLNLSGDGKVLNNNKKKLSESSFLFLYY